MLPACLRYTSLKFFYITLPVYTTLPVYILFTSLSLGLPSFSSGTINKALLQCSQTQAPFAVLHLLSVGLIINEHVGGKMA